MAFVRYVLSQDHPDSGLPDGVFRLAYHLRANGGLESAQRNTLNECLGWFERNLPIPSRFNRSKSKGFYRRNARGISWFKDSATECLERIRRVVAVLEKNGHRVEMIAAERVGYVVYSDDLQVIAEPFADAPTGKKRRDYHR